MDATHVQVETVVDDAQVTIVVRGELDLGAAPALEAAIDAALAQPGEALSIDLAEVSFIDSTGLRCLLHAHEVVDAAGRTVRLRRPSPAVTKVLDMTGTRSMFG